MKKTLATNLLPKKQKVILQIKNNVENKPRLGQGRAGIKHKKPQIIENKTTTANKSHAKLNMPMTENVSKQRTHFPAQEQSMSSSKTEAITRGKIQDKNRKILFYPDSIYRPSLRPPQYLCPQDLESKANNIPRIDIRFEKNSLYQEGIISKAYQRPDKSSFQELKGLES